VYSVPLFGAQIRIILETAGVLLGGISSSSPWYGVSKHLWNVGKLIPDCPLQQLRRRSSSGPNFTHSWTKVKCKMTASEAACIERTCRGVVPDCGSITHAVPLLASWSREWLRTHPFRIKRNRYTAMPLTPATESQARRVVPWAAETPFASRQWFRLPLPTCPFVSTGEVLRWYKKGLYRFLPSSFCVTVHAFILLWVKFVLGKGR
jgi:hypothetical protein